MKLRDLLLKAASHGVAQVLGVILFLGGAGIGVSMLTAPTTYSSYHVLAVNFMFASPVAWGVTFLVASLALVVTVLIEPAYAQLPALLLGAVFIAFGVLILASGSTAMVWAFVALGWISIFTQILCWAEEHRGKAVVHSYQS